MGFEAEPVRPEAYLLYTRRDPTYGPRRSKPTLTGQNEKTLMRAETEKLVDEIKQAISLLRRHL